MSKPQKTSRTPPQHQTNCKLQHPTSSFNLKFQFLITTSNFNFKFQLQLQTSTSNFDLQASTLKL